MKTVRKTIILSVLFAVCISLFSGCSDEKELYSATFTEYFDTVTTVTAYCNSEREFNELVKVTEKELMQFHQLFDAYNEYEGVVNIATLNRNAANEPLTVSEELADFLEFSRGMYGLTLGEVNIALGAVTIIWKEAFETKTLPTDAALTEAAGHVNLENMVMGMNDEDEPTVFFEDVGLKLDVGAIAKGYTADAVALRLFQENHNNVLLSIGGTVITVGDKIGEEWSVGITDPENTSEVKTSVVLTDGQSISTSGGYQRYFTYEGEQYHHIIDSVEMIPQDYYASVSVIYENAAMGDTISTALFNMPFEQSSDLAKRLNTKAIYIFNDGTTQTVN